jgi:hypothetical protein
MTGLSKQNVLLTGSSMLGVLLFTFHIADDIVRGFEAGKLSNLGTIPICVAWLSGTLLLAGRQSGYLITLVFSLLSIGVPYLHMRGKGLAAVVEGTAGGFFFSWTLLAIGITGLFSVILAVQGLLSLRRAQMAQ